MKKNIIGIKLEVPFKEKDKAKAEGARWEPTEKTWYYPVDDKLQNFVKWLNPETLLYSSKPVDDMHTLPQTPQGIRRYFMQIRKGYKCHKCKNEMNIIAAFNKPPKNRTHTKDHEYTLVWEKPKSFVEFAKTLGIPMKFTRTSVVDEPYSLHVCPKCKAIQGDFYMFEDKDCMLPEENSFYVIYDEEKDIWEIEK